MEVEYVITSKLAKVETSNFSERERRLLTALKLLLKGQPVRLDNGTVIALAYSKNGCLVPIRGEETKPKEPISDIEFYPLSDWSVKDFFEYIMENVSDKTHTIMCANLALMK